MTFVKLIFALLFLIPVAILMWYLLNKLIVEFTNSVKKSRDEQQKSVRVSRDAKRSPEKEQKRYSSHGNLTKKTSVDADHPQTQEESKSETGRSRMKQMADKRKRRKERKKERSLKQADSTKKDKE